MLRHSCSAVFLFPVATGTALAGATAIAKATAQPVAVTGRIDYPRRVRIKLGAGWASTAAITVLLFGTNRVGVALATGTGSGDNGAESIVIPANSSAGQTFESVNVYSSIQDVQSFDTPAGWTAGTFAVELSGTFGLPTAYVGNQSGVVMVSEATLASGASVGVADGTINTNGAYTPTTVIDGAHSFVVNYSVTV